MTMHDEYFEYCETYTKKYGPNTIVLIECGSFFEIYAVINEKETIGPNIQQICDILNIQLSRKNKAITEVDRGNPFMAGFPSYALPKHSQVLLSNNYTVVLVRQITSPPNPKREVTEVLSPSIQIQPNTHEGNYLMAVYWDVYTDKFNKRCLLAGMSGVDVSTGKTWIYEITNINTDVSYVIDEFIRCYYLYQPKEVILLGHNLTVEERIMIKNMLDNTKTVHELWNIFEDTHTQFTNVVYQNKILEKAYEMKCMLKPIEVLDMEKYDNARIAFCYMIQFAYEHNASLIAHLQKPAHISLDSEQCILEYNSAIQLQILGSQIASEKPLLSILNRCATAFGRRNFKERLLQPIYNIEKLNERYDEIQYMIDNNIFDKVHKELKEVLDLERIARKMYTGNYSPIDWSGYDNTLNAIINVLEILGKDKDKIVATNLQKDYEDILNIDEANKYNLQQGIKSNIFKKGIYPDVDELQYNVDQYREILENCVEQFVEGAKIEFTDRDGYVIVMTKKRWDTAKSKMKRLGTYQEQSIDIKEIEAKSLSSSSSNVKLKHKYLDKISNEIIRYTELLSFNVLQKYKNFLKDYATKNIDNIIEIVAIISDIDILSINAKNAVEYNYTRPTLQKNDNSFVTTKSLRHPILERLHISHEYIVNDIEIGKEERGVLLFGINASGKSSLMKAIGCNVLMAQAGMYVSCKEMVLAPYRKIFTRITSMDNIYRGWSTFTVEMLELRNILHRCDKYSLILGDELCSGTEAISALAIVSSGIKKLVENNSSFIFATHLHDLPKIKVIENLSANKTIRLAHMHIEVDENGKLIFDRKLRDGSGNSLYGLEVCKGLDMPKDFLKYAHEIRCDIQGTSSLLHDDKQSRYNANVFMGECAICKKTPSETHHIHEQYKSNANGFIEELGFHKNKEFNLLPVCEECHQNIHNGQLQIKGYKQTSEGIILEVKTEEKKKRIYRKKNMTTN